MSEIIMITCNQCDTEQPLGECFVVVLDEGANPGWCCCVCLVGLLTTLAADNEVYGVVVNPVGTAEEIFSAGEQAMIGDIYDHDKVGG